MGYQLNILSPVTKEVQESYDWYEEQQQGLGKGFANEVDIFLQKIEINPFLFQAKYKQVRKASLIRFPFNIYYLLRDKDIITVIGIQHSSRHEVHWKNRIK